jgi:hypothetical protein
MSSPSQIAASRANGRKSRGPRTAAGKAASSRNALRHGLTADLRRNPTLMAEMDDLLRAYCGDLTDPLLIDQVLIIASCDVLLRLLRNERMAVIERLHDSSAIALVKGDNSMELASARGREFDRAVDELKLIAAKHGIQEKSMCYMYPPETDNMPPQPGWQPNRIQSRHETDALCEALPDLMRLNRYERRAWSRRKRAMREFMRIKSSEAFAGASTSVAAPSINSSEAQAEANLDAEASAASASEQPA